MKSIIKYIASLIVFGFNLSVSVLAQSDRVTGTVYDENGVPLPGITVYLVETGMGTFTNLSGVYNFSGITDPYCEQVLTLQVSVTGYYGTTVQYYEHCDGGTQTVNIFLIPDRAPIMVTNTEDSGDGSLRQAILDANANPGKDYIHFDVPELGLASIQPLSPLPGITDAVVINGFTQPGSSMNTSPSGTGFNTRLQVELDGSDPGSILYGLIIQYDNCEIRGLIINRFDYAGLYVTSDANRINDCFIGTDPLGNTTGYGNLFIGTLLSGSSSNLIQRCVISGNEGAGDLYFRDESNMNLVVGNMIGTDVSGMHPLHNASAGLMIASGSGNTIGGNDIGMSNIIFGGLTVSGGSDNRVINNYLGPDITGLSSIGPGIDSYGVAIGYNASNNEIGPNNVISGNKANGILFAGDNNFQNRVFGNYIGVAADGNTPMPNGQINVLILNSASNNRIGGLTTDSANVISGGPNDGILMRDSSVTGNVVLGNLIGTNASGTTAVPNGTDGIEITGGAHNNIIQNNLISGNGENGIYISGLESTGNLVIGNRIGTNATGLGAIANAVGIRLEDVQDITIGGPGPGERNIISGSTGAGIWFYGPSTNVAIVNNYIGTDVNGELPIPNNRGIYMYYGTNITIGPDNLISGNVREGIDLIYDVCINTKIIGNRIGTNADGSAPLPNNDGIVVYRATNTTIGGTLDGERNIISGNDRNGVSIGFATGTEVMGNYIGTDLSGALAVPNAYGVSCEAPGNYIGTGANGAGNLIAFNLNTGVILRRSGAFVFGNTIIHGNDYGILVSGTDNVIGSSNPKDRNYIYGNSSTGIRITEGNNIIEGNYLGTDKEGRLDLTDGSRGIGIESNNNIIRNNLISGYSGSGIRIQGDIEPYATENRIEGNRIGLNADGDGYIPNDDGIAFYSGTDNIIIGNEIAGNTGTGIRVSDVFGECYNNQLSQNQIYKNGELGIDLNADGVTENDIDPLDPDEGPNHLQNFPELNNISFGEGNVTVSGVLSSGASSTYNLEFFSSGVGDPTTYGEGEFYLGSEEVQTDGNGEAIFECTLPTVGYGAEVITATATDVDGNTSEFSQVIGGVKDQVLAEMPFRYTLNSEGLSTVPLADYQNAIQSAFQTWNDIPTAEIQMEYAGDSDEKYASATDGLNLISFQDDHFPFGKGVLAVTAKTLQVSAGGMEAEILDADIVFNPAYITDPFHPFAVLEDGDNDTMSFDIQTVATHEIGHILGMIHSGVYYAKMFFMLGYGRTERDLGLDDIAWASYRYPNSLFDQSRGLISGTITYGDLGDPGNPSTHPPVAGALVLAVTTDTQNQEMFHAYSDANGNYTVPILRDGVTSDEYWIYIQPLDGNVYGTALKPENVSPYIYSHTIFTDFPEEFYDAQESYNDTDGNVVAIPLSEGGTVTGINLITNADLTSPTVLGVSPDEGAENVAVSPTMVMKFSEPVDIYSFDENTCYLENLNTPGETVAGDFTILADSTHIMLMKPVESLQYSTTYALHIDGITDRKGNSLETAYTRNFTTLPPDDDPPEVYDVIPADGSTQVDVTKPVKVFFSEPMNKSSVESGFLLATDENEPVEGTFSWDLANKELTYTPDFSMSEGTDYIISLSTLVTDLAGNPMEDDASFAFSTVDVAAPQIVYLGPADGKSGITVETPVVVKVSEPLDLTTITPSSFSLTGTSGQVNGTYEYLDDDRTIVFRPAQALQFNQPYTITLTSDISDMSYPRQYLLQTTAVFTTAASTTLPHILYMEPPFGAVGAKTTIVGSGFDPVKENNLVSFDGIAAIVDKATLESVSVFVPVSAEDGPVTVSVNGTDADNSFVFDVVPVNTEPSYSVVAGASSGSNTRAVVINPDAAYAYVTNWGDNTVTPLNLSGDTPVPEEDIQVGVEPMDIDLNPEGTLAYVTNYLSNTVSVIGTDLSNDDSLHRVVNTIPVGYHPYGVAAASNKKVYVANNESEYVSVIDMDPNSGGFDHVIANLSTGSNNRSIVVTPDAALILVTGENGVAIIDGDPVSPTFNDVIARASAGSSTRGITITPDAALALAVTEGGIILIIDIYQPPGTQFGSVIASVNTGSSARNITISPDAAYVYITNPDENTVSVYQLDYSVVPGFGASLNNPLGLIHIATIQVDDEPYAIAGHPNSEYILVTHDSETGGVTKISVKEAPLDVIQTLEELIESVKEARQDGVIPSLLGLRLLLDLNQTLNRINWNLPGAAILTLDQFIRKVERNIQYGRIPAELGNAWLETAFLIRDQLVKDFEAKVEALKGAGDLTTGRETSLESQIEVQRDQLDVSTLNLETQPNPFSSFTQINFEVPGNDRRETPVMLRVFNTSGQVVSTLVNMHMEPGRYSIQWNGEQDQGGMVAEGVYLMELRTADHRKALIISVIR